MATTTACFKIHGDWLTDFVRSQWAEGSFDKAFKTLEAAFPDMSFEQMADIIRGKKKLEGVNDMVYVDDDWEPNLKRCQHGEYPDPKQQMFKGLGQIEENKTLKEDLEYVSAVTSCPTARHSTSDAYERVVVVRNRTSRYRNPEKELEYDVSFVPEETEEVKNFMDSRPNPAEMPSNKRAFISKWLLEQTKEELEEEEKRDRERIESIQPLTEGNYTKYGWIDREGNFFGCPYEGHRGLAEDLLVKKGEPDLYNPEGRVEELGWVKCMATGCPRDEPSMIVPGDYDKENVLYSNKEQLDTIKKYCKQLWPKGKLPFFMRGGTV